MIGTRSTPGWLRGMRAAGERCSGTQWDAVGRSGCRIEETVGVAGALEESPESAVAQWAAMPGG